MILRGSVTLSTFLPLRWCSVPRLYLAKEATTKLDEDFFNKIKVLNLIAHCTLPVCVNRETIEGDYQFAHRVILFLLITASNLRSLDSLTALNPPSQFDLRLS